MSGLMFTTRVTLNQFPKIKAGMEQRSGQIVRKTALDLEAGMKKRAPNKTGVTPAGNKSKSSGFLMNSIQAEKVGRSHWRVTVGAEYGLYVEYGTRHTRAQPFFHPTITEVSGTFIEAMKRITQ